MEKQLLKKGKGKGKDKGQPPQESKEEENKEEEDDDRPVCLVTRDGLTIYHGKNLNPDILLPGDKIFTVIGDVTFIRKEEQDDDDKSEEEENNEDFNKT